VIGVRLSPLDSWQFGLGIPSQAETASQLARESAMPPSPATVAGALRAALARAHGWDGTSSWSADPKLRKLVALIGDGPDHLGQAAFAGPLLADGKTVLVPVPRTTVCQDGNLVTGYAPGDPVHCDLGPAVRLPEAFGEAAGWPSQPPEDGLVTVAEARSLLGGGQVPCERLRQVSELWAFEPRTGIARDRVTRAAAEGALFEIVHVRPQPGHDPGLVVLAKGPPGQAWDDITGLIPLGSEGRLAHLEVDSGAEAGLKVSMEVLQRVAQRGEAALAVLTPALLTPAQWRGQEPLAELGGARLVCAIGPRPLRLGGWDGRHNAPVPQRSFVAPGTVLFVGHGDGKALAQAIETLGDAPQVGSRTEAGFGLVLVGSWPSRTQETPERRKEPDAHGRARSAG
jgi:CRISPR-associated protein Cmr3